MTRLPERLPAPLSERLASATQSIYSRQGREVDVSIGGIPFRYATSNDLPYTVETIPIQRNQVDTEADPGEQSLSTWWRRSQSSWHDGAGDLYQENYGYGSSLRFSNSASFYDSAGVDVFTPGRLTLLKRMDAWAGAPTLTKNLRTAYDASAGDHKITAIANGALYRAPAGGTFTVIHDPAPNLADGLVVGSGFYSVAVDGTLYSGTIASPGTATTWALTNTVSDAPSFMLWGKHRLWVVGDRCLWQPDTTAASGSQAPVYVNPNTGWTYTCAAEGSSAMLFGGHDGYTSSIQSISLDSGGGLPTLSGAAVTATMPNGELVQQIAVLAGQYIGIGTSRGFRVGVIDGSGQITYGPLVIEGSGSCTALTTQGQFFVVAFDYGVYRVDSGNPLDSGVFPYARDIDCGGHVVSSLAVSDDRLVAATSDTSQTWIQSTDHYVSSGWLQTGRIRYRTTEEKLFKRISLETDPLAGQIAVSLMQDSGGLLAVGNLTVQGEVSEGDMPIILTSPMRFASVQFTLTPDAAGTSTPVLHSYCVSALPAVAPQRMYTIPLLCYDKEKSASGQWYGGHDFAADRLLALQTLEDAADTVIFQDFTGLDSTGRTVTIDSLRFVQTAPSNLRTAGSISGTGGILVAQLRTVT